MLKRSVDGGAIGLYSLCILVDRHLNRLEDSSKAAIINALKELGRSVEKYDKYSLAEMCKIMRESDEGTKVSQNVVLNKFVIVVAHRHNVFPIFWLQLRRPSSLLPCICSTSSVGAVVRCFHR